MNAGIAYPSLYKPFITTFNAEVIRGLDDVNNFDLIIFTGGEDVSPELYGGKRELSYGTNKFRDNIELSILDMALKLNKKVLGVCRGHQLINVYLGGTLVQDIRKQGFNPHNGTHAAFYNRAHFGKSKRFVERLLYLYPQVNSLHHQGVKVNLSKNPVIASYEDIVELTLSRNILTTQFHPEWLNRFNDFSKLVEDWVNAST